MAITLCRAAQAVEQAAPSPVSANVNTSIRATDGLGFSGPYENKPIHHSSAIGTNRSANQASASTGSGGWDLSRVPIALGAVILLIFSLRWMVRSLGGYQSAKGSNRGVQVLSRTTVSPRQQMLVLQFGRRLVLVGSGGTELKPLCQIDDPDEVAEVLSQIRQGSANLAARRFSLAFGQAEKAFQKGEPSSSQAEPEAPDAEDLPAIEQPPADRGEMLTGLMDRIRRMSEQFQQV